MKHTFELAWNYYWIFTTFFSNFVVIYWKAKEEKKREKLWRNRRTFWRIYCNLIDDEISYLNLHEELLSRVYQNFRASINSTIGSNDKKKKKESIIEDFRKAFIKKYELYPFDGQERLEEEIARISEKSMLSTRAKSIRVFSSLRRGTGKFWFWKTFLGEVLDLLIRERKFFRLCERRKFSGNRTIS